MPVKPIKVVTHEWTEASIETAFDVIIPIDLTSVFTGYGPIPAVKAVTDQTGDWNAAGQTRKLILADGGETAERIDAIERPAHFQYTVGPFSKPLGLLVDRAEGEFRLEPMAQGTSVHWTYDWYAQNGFTKPVLWVFTLLWRAYSRKSLYACVQAATAAAAK